MKTPFKFLEPYKKSDRNLFFGRDEEISALYNMVSRSNMVVVYGKSGVGKTSLIKCGLENEFDESEVKMVEIRRRLNINESLRLELATLLKIDDTEGINPEGLVEKVYNRYLRPVYLFFDQFEELFILGSYEEKKKFLHILSAIRKLEIPYVVILIIREEYLAELTDFKQEVPFLFDFTMQVKQMDQVRSTKVVKDIFEFLQKEPFTDNDELLQIDFNQNDKLQSKIVEIVANGKFFVELPYLQVYLDKLFKIAYENRNGKIVIDKSLLEDERLRSIEAVISNLLDEQIKKATEKIGETSDAKVLSLLKVLITEKDTKMPVALSKLLDKAEEQGFSKEQVEICLDIFTNALLLRPLERNQYELSHDSLAAKISLMRPAKRREKPVIQGNPYKGLAAFTEKEEDVKRFFGRRDAIDKVLSLLELNTLVVISGASGTGKSSLVKAGIYPELKDKGYQLFEIRPGEYPLDHLNRAIARINSHVNEAAGFLLVIDQHEELITRSKREKDVEAFNQILLKLINDYQNVLQNVSKRKTLKIIITIRADFEPQFKVGALEQYWDKGRYVVPYMSTRELEQVIESPAELAACYFEPLTLIRNIAEEVAGRPASLPLLSFALSQMFEASLPERIISKEIYDKIGVFGALQTKANDIYDNLPDEATRRTMRQVLLRMVSLEGSEVASRRVYLEELQYISENENKRVNVILKELTQERLAVQNRDESGLLYVEPAHDALLRGWTKLWEWIKEFGKENILFRERLSAAIIEWNAHNHSTSLLWSDERRVYEIKDLLTSNDVWINRSELTFCNESLEHWKNLENAKKAEEETRQMLIQEQNNLKFKARRRRNIAVASLLVGGLFFFLALWSYIKAEQAKVSEERAILSNNEAKLQSEVANREKARADSLLGIAENKKTEAIDNLQLAQIEGKRAVDALQLVKEQKAKTELERQKAEKNLSIAIQKAEELSLAQDSLENLYKQTQIAKDVAIQSATEAKALANQIEQQKEQLDSLNDVLKKINQKLNNSLITKSDSINELNNNIDILSVLAPFKETSRNSSLVKQYQENISKQTDYRALWPPSSKLKVGDIGRFYQGAFIVEGNLSSFDIPFEINEGLVGKTDFDFMHAKVQIEYDNLKNTYTLRFPKNSYLMQSNNVKIIRIANLSFIADFVSKLYKKGDWDKNLLIVTELVETENGVVIASSDKEAGELVISSKTPQKNKPGALPANFVILVNKNVPLVLTGQLTPLFKAFGIRNNYR